MTNGTMTMLFGKQYSKDVNNFTAAEIYFLESCMKEIAGQTSRVMEVTMLLMGMREKTKDKPDSLDGTELDDSDFTTSKDEQQPPANGKPLIKRMTYLN
jgi:hypothetical protein